MKNTIKKLDHIAIAVPNLDKAVEIFRKILGFEHEKEYVVKEEGVKVAFFSLSNIHIELMQPLDDKSPIKTFIDKRGGGLHHLCFETDDIEQFVKNRKNQDIRFLSEPKKVNAERKVVFTHPASTAKILIEFLQK